MARQSHTAQEPPGKYPATPLTAESADFTWTAADAANKEEVTLTGREIILIRNDDAGAQTVTFDSVVDDKNRKGDITDYSVGAGKYAHFGPFPKDGWAQTDGTLHFEASDANIHIAVIKLPSLP